MFSERAKGVCMLGSRVFFLVPPLARAKYKMGLSGTEMYLVLVRDIMLQSVTFFLSGFLPLLLSQQSWSNKVNIHPFTEDQGTCSVVFPHPALYDCEKQRGQAQT